MLSDCLGCFLLLLLQLQVWIHNCGEVNALKGIQDSDAAGKAAGEDDAEEEVEQEETAEEKLKKKEEEEEAKLKAVDQTKMNPRQKKLFELRMKMVLAPFRPCPLSTPFSLCFSLCFRTALPPRRLLAR